MLNYKYHVLKANKVTVTVDGDEDNSRRLIFPSKHESRGMRTRK